ncbi:MULTISPECIES: hypothetical protein [Shimia]|nr:MULTISPECIES: hypothetical protein [Shimia]MDV4145610.1 hypothetical protein [Shimia sp. FJ5]
MSANTCTGAEITMFKGLGLSVAIIVGGMLGVPALMAAMIQ